MRRYFRDFGEGFRILCSRDFWRDFRSYWAPSAIAARLDEFTASLEERRRR